MPGRVAVEVERAEPTVAVAQREGEHRRQPASSAAGANCGNRSSVAQVRHRDGLPGPVRRQARPLAELGLQLARSAAPTRPTPRCSAGRRPGEISVTPAAVTGRTSTMRSTRWSRIPWIGKSVTSVRANSLNTAEVFSWTTDPPRL